jgi:hypothetical protein
MAEFDGVRNEDGFGVLGEDAITAIVEKCGAQVEAIQGTVVPRAADSGLVMDKDVAAGWAHGRCIKVVVAKEGVPSGSVLGRHAGLEEVEGELCLGE